jgi:hypothetical protein
MTTTTAITIQPVALIKSILSLLFLAFRFWRIKYLKTDLPCQKEKGQGLLSKEIIFFLLFQTFLKYIFLIGSYLYFGTESGSTISYHQVILTERPSHRFLLKIFRPFLVLMRARKPLFLNLLILLRRGFSILFFQITYDSALYHIVG